MSIEKEIEAVKKSLEALDRKRQQEIGKRDQILSSLKAKGINSYEEGLEVKRQREEAYKAYEEQARKLLDSIKEEFKDYI